MSKKVLTYISLAVGCLACLASIFYLINAIQVASNYQWTDSDAKGIIYEAIIALTLACVTVCLVFSGVKIVKAFLDKNDINYSLLALPMITYFASEVIFNGIVIGFWGFDNIRAWIFAVLGIAGLVLTLVPLFSKQEEKNANIIALVAAILGFVVSVVDLTNAGGVAAASLVFIMFMFGCVAAIYITYVFVEYNNNQPKSEAKEEKAIEAPESNDSEEKAE